MRILETHTRLKFTFVIILTIFFYSEKGYSQNISDSTLIQFSGVIVTSDSIAPISYAHIIDLNTGFGTVSDYSGYFSFAAYINDTIRFSAVGFKDGFFIIPDTISIERYTLFQVMTRDTIYLSETVIYPWPTKEAFKDAFMNLEIPDDYLEIARENLNNRQIAERVIAMSADGSENYRHAIDNMVRKNYYAGQPQPISVFNVFAWVDFIKAWKEGKFKRKDKKYK